MRTQLSDEAYLAELMLRIADKEGVDRDFKLNPHQRMLDLNLTGRDLVPKARQLGVSSFAHAKQFIRCLKERNTRAVVISHDEESTRRHLIRVQYFINTIRGPKPIVKNMSANEITFPKTNSMFYIGTAGSRKFGRGDTITDLHCSEYAFWPNPAELMTGLLQAVPLSGRIIIESTGNGLNDYYHRCMRAEKGGSRWKCHFLPWHREPEYQIPGTPEEDALFMEELSEEFEEFQALAFGLTIPQIRWRRYKLEELDFDLKKFKQEYPISLDECFQVSGNSIFHRINYTQTERWKKYDSHSRILDGHPNPHYSYVLGGDPAGGVGKDFSCIQILCCETGEQVFEYTNNKIDPEAFGERIEEVGKMFFYPYAVVENNNHGILTLSVLSKIYPVGMLYHDGPPSGHQEAALKYGKQTNRRTRPLFLNTLRSDMAQGEITVHSPVCYEELTTFVEHDDGKLSAQDGCHDDTVIALALANYKRNKAQVISENKRKGSVKKREKNDPFLFDNILNAMRKHGRFPIDAQHRTGIQNLNARR